MKNTIHPTMYPTVFIDISSGDKIFTASTMQVEEKMEIDGVTYQVVRADITSHSHPFFTGEMRFVDERGQVDRFKQKMKLAEERQAAAAEKAASKKKAAAEPTETKSYQEVLRDQQAVLRKNTKATPAATTQG